MVSAGRAAALQVAAAVGFAAVAQLPAAVGFAAAKDPSGLNSIYFYYIEADDEKEEDERKGTCDCVSFYKSK